MTPVELKALRSGFNDELQKIAGFSRSGVRPFKAATLLSKKRLVKGSSMKKMGSGSDQAKGLLKGNKKALALLAAGALGGDQLRRAKDDWSMGRQIRRQQGM